MELRMKLRLKLVNVGLLITAASLMGACSSIPSAPTVLAPSALQAPANQQFAFEMSATGVQIYVCKTSKADAAKMEWTFVAPEAELFNRSGNKVGKHYAGPSWESDDGSKVVGAVVSKLDSTDGNAIPWLLLKNQSNSGSGLFANVQSIQRVATVAGKAPSTGCDATTLNTEIRVPYQAIYNFFVAK